MSEAAAAGGGAAVALHGYAYAVVRVVPNIEREELINVGVVLYARTLGYLECRIDEAERIAGRLSALVAPSPGFDLARLEAHLRALPALCAGERGAGPVAALSQSERFHWLTTHRSTMIQSSVLHSGVCADPRAALAALFEKTVLPPRRM